MFYFTYILYKPREERVMNDEKIKELEELAREYEDGNKESPRVMTASCYGGGGSTTYTKPQCIDSSGD
uniref:Uncharacterized protein n=1 Tax=Candidatus Kentrum sp. FM TaxID=2126340 RepID=A0A450TSY2_9GAMM|nr:MAG: hypothetical protein BECKFM1743C_GA0114222_105996 [Candidatus Kentron sp. FM]VFJ71664.1 MAG: hypothetical protein BECKFM1743A_GA0114220_105996 [Candidatus Kentron sp. FM]VFK19628.1 MAG: hypothetical protein BECKFM1743B_GA0114221_106336 [Candidatus Kentron sp. FM]